jgi:16S rRNA (cytidine1402-2'-O)-methyltransferase
MSLNFNWRDPCVIPKTLYIVATPIGHMEDMTIRAIKILNQVDLIAAEDTRETQKLLKHYLINTPMLACHDHNESQCAETIINQLNYGKSIGLVSDAGTPAISDPGYRVVSMVLKEGFSVVPIPGVSAVMTALCVSGLPTDVFLFQGFLPKKQGKRQKILKQLSVETGTLAFYESPKRIVSLLEDVLTIFGDRPAMIGRELTKPYEECIRGTLSTILRSIEQKKAIKGEFTLLVGGCNTNHDFDKKSLHQQIANFLKDHADLPLSHNVKTMVKLVGESRKTIYDIALQIKNNQ